MKSHRMRTIGVLAVGLLALLVATGVTGASGTFAPTITLELSTNRATAHPDARITIDNSGSAENVKAITVQLPNGLWGSLAAAVKCDYQDAQDGECDPDSQIGTVDTTAKIDDSDARLRGKIYLTEPAPANVATDPAGLTIVVPGKVGSVDLGNVVVNGRVSVRTAELPGGAVTGAVGAVEGISTTIDSVPEEIYDSANDRTVRFQLQAMRADLHSDLDGPRPPLLTNPSTCGAVAATATVTSYQNSVENITSPSINIDQCDTVKFSGTFDATPSSSTSGTLSGLDAEIGFPSDSGTMKSVSVRLPSSIGPNTPSFGYQADMCPSAANISAFNPAACPAQAKVGTVSIETPLLADPLIGNVWLINKSPIPNIGIDISPTTGPNNPAGVIMRLVGISSTMQEDASCDSDCKTQIVSTFNNIPDAPTTKIELNIGGPARAGSGGPLDGELFAIATSADTACQPADEFSIAMTSNAISGTALRSDVVDTQTISGCAQREIAIPSSSPIGGSTTNRTPTVAFEDAPGSSSAQAYCYFNRSFDIDLNDVSEACADDYTPATNLPYGVTRFGVRKGVLLETRAFVVRASSPAPDVTAPTTTITSPVAPVTTGDPTLEFSSDNGNSFQCAISPGSTVTTAYLPCGSGTSASADLSDLNHGELIAGVEYTFGVRAQDLAGNVDTSPATRTFTVDIPFDPSFESLVSTSVARAHPDLDVTFENRSHEDIKNVELNLPDGFMGAITGVASLCPLAVADAGNCSVASQVGTVQAEAVVDESIVRTTGTVYLTDPRQPGVEPASLSIKIEPQVQEVVFDDILVNVNLKVRGVAQGIDSFALNLPKSATNAIDGETEFDLRKMVLKLRTGAGAGHPLLTNPSDCRAMAFTSKIDGYDASSVSRSVPFTPTGCENLSYAPALGITQFASNGGGVPKQSTLAKVENVDFTATMTADPGGAAIKTVDLVLPKPLTIDVAFLPYPCQEAEAALKACPASSAIGSVSAISPLLDAPLTGNVYVLKSPTSLPRLLIALRGRIDVDLVAASSFTGPEFNMIRTQFEFIPDVPMTSFTMRVNKFLRTRDDACKTPPSEWSILGSMGAYNGASQAVNIPLTFDCASDVKPGPSVRKPKDPTIKPGKKFKLSRTIDAEDGKKIKKLTVKLPKGLKFESKSTTKKRIGRYITVKADGKKLKSKCFKRRNSTTFEVRLCGKKVKKIQITFKKGAIKASRKFTKKKPAKLKFTVIDSSNKKWSPKQP